MKLGNNGSTLFLSWVSRRTLSGQEHPTRGCTVHRVRQLELEARRGATTNFFSDNNRGVVFSNSTTTIPTRPSSAAFPPPDDESKQQHLELDSKPSTRGGT
mmetsp:Transcript_52375/g.59484  ORF Transcript_52375/g.59484 Transcript_52375/m.59484 type:complete len:101 (-) Transcript_52375:149-451(-)